MAKCVYYGYLCGIKIPLNTIIMKKVFLVLMIALMAIPVLAQETGSQTVVQQKKGRVPSEKKACISAGLLQGGGGLVGVDFEYLLGQHLSVQAGAGFISFGAAINYHFKPYINSSMLSLAYYHQGVGNTHTTSWLGPVYTFRAPKIFQCQIGFGYAVDFGPSATQQMKDVPFSLLYSIGVYFPI